MSQTITHDAGRIVEFVLEATTREAISAWADSVMATIEAWPPDQAYATLQNFAVVDGLSPALHVAVERVNSHFLTKTFPSRWIAVLLPDTPLGRQIGPLLIERGMGEAGLERKVFTEHAAALAWLRAGIDRG